MSGLVEGAFYGNPDVLVIISMLCALSFELGALSLFARHPNSSDFRPGVGTKIMKKRKAISG